MSDSESTKGRIGLIRSVAAAIVGVALAALCVALTGLLDIQAFGTRGGGVFDLDNQLIAVTRPATPILETAAVAVVGAVLFFVLSVFTGNYGTRVKVPAIAGFLAAGAVLVVWSFRIDAQYANREGPPFASGIEGWVQEGGTNAAVHLLLFLLLGSLTRTLVFDRASRESDETEDDDARRGGSS